MVHFHSGPRLRRPRPQVPCLAKDSPGFSRCSDGRPVLSKGWTPPQMAQRLSFEFSFEATNPKWGSLNQKDEPPPNGRPKQYPVRKLRE